MPVLDKVRHTLARAIAPAPPTAPPPGHTPNPNYRYRDLGGDVGFWLNDSGDPVEISSTNPLPTKSTQTNGTPDAQSSEVFGSNNQITSVAVAGHASVGMHLDAGTLIGTIIPVISFDNGATWVNSKFVEPATLLRYDNVVFASANTAVNYSIETIGGVTHAGAKLNPYVSGSANIKVTATVTVPRTFSYLLGAQSNVLTSAIASIMASLPLGIANATAPSLTEGRFSQLSLDLNNNLRVTLGNNIAGENNITNRLNVEPIYSWVVINTATTTTIKSGAGTLHTICILGGTLGTVTAYDNTAGSGTSIFPSFTPSATLPNPSIICDISFTTGLTIVTGSATIILVTYR
jgi:hypothetical protein